MSILARLKPTLAAFALLAALTLSVTPHQIDGDPQDISPVSALSSPDLKTPYFLDLRTIVPVVCYHFPAGVDVNHLEKITPDQLAKTSVSAGTGTIFAHNRVLTAQHVINGASICTLAGKVPVTIAYASLDDDIAVLDAEIGSTPVTPISCDPYEKGKPYLMFGYAQGTDFAMDYGEFTGVYVDVTIADKEVTGGVRKLPHASIFPGAVTPGMSGGPVVDLSGHIRGINNATGPDYAASRQLADTALCTAMKPAPTDATK